MKIKTLPILLAFLVMGVADAMGPMASAVQENYELSTVMATLLTFFVFIAFAVFSVPGGVLATRIGKKNLLLLGLGLNIIAMAIPTFLYQDILYYFFVFSFWVLERPFCRLPAIQL